MVHDDLLTRRLPSASRRDATPFLRRPPPSRSNIFGGTSRENDLTPSPSSFPSLKWHRTARLLEFLRHSIFFFSSRTFFFSSFFFTLLFAFRIGNRERDEESSTNARDFRKITESIVPSRFQPSSSLSLSFPGLYFFSLVLLLHPRSFHLKTFPPTLSNVLFFNFVVGARFNFAS